MHDVSVKNKIIGNQMANVKFLQANQLGSGIIDENYQLTHVNSILADLLGYSKPEIINHSILSFVEPGYKNDLSEKLKSVVDEENVTTLIRFLRKDKQQVSTLLSLSKLEAENQNSRSTAIFVIDINHSLILKADQKDQAPQSIQPQTNIDQVLFDISRSKDIKHMLDLVFMTIESSIGIKGSAFFEFTDKTPLAYSRHLNRLIEFPRELLHNFRSISDSHPDILNKKVFTFSEIDLASEHMQTLNDFFHFLNSEHNQDQKALLVIPFQNNNITKKGFFVFTHTSIDKFTPEAVKFVEVLAIHATIAFDNLLLFKDYECFSAHEERLKISRDLHDTIAQHLYSLILYGETSRRALLDNKTDLVEEYLNEIVDLSHEAMNDLRFLIFKLRPPLLDEIGFVNAIVARLDLVEKRSGINAECYVFGEPNLTSHLENELYWIIIEALNNVMKHAKAKNTFISLHFFDNRTLIVVKDDGKGFIIEDPACSSGIGLKSIKERTALLGGEINIESTIGQGTTLTINISNK